MSLQHFKDNAGDVFLNNGKILFGISPTGSIGTLKNSIDLSGRTFDNTQLDICGGELFRKTVGLVLLDI